MNLRNRMSCAAAMILFLVSAGSAQIIENPDKPKSPDAGRVIVPKEAMKITDESGEFFFKYPRNLKIGPDGSIWVVDSEQFLHFDKDIRFRGNIYKKGQGPGETSQFDNFGFPEEGGIVVHSFSPPKMMWFDKNDKFVREIPLTKNPRARFLGRFHEKWIFDNADIPRFTGEPRYMDRSHQILAWDEKTNEWASLTSFNCAIYAASDGRSSGWFDIASLLMADLGQGRIAISHTQEYAIKIYQTASNKIGREFRRVYRRVPPPPLKPGQKRGQLGLNEKIFEEPERKYQNDIRDLHAVDGRIWAVTSTQDPEKGILIDVFDAQGSYQDAFFIKFPDPSRGSFQMNPDGKSVFTLESNEDGTWSIKKYLLK